MTISNDPESQLEALRSFNFALFLDRIATDLRAQAITSRQACESLQAFLSRHGEEVRA